jgi:monoamine oxidase
MVSYSDNHRADAVKKASDTDIQRLTGAVFTDSVRFYWKRGTHYYRPLAPGYRDRDEFIRKAQNPEPGVFLVGECISKNQGWTEGALESVLAVAPLWFL